MKNKKHMIISIYAKRFHKIQYPFIIKTLRKVDLKTPCVNIIKAIYNIPIANIILGGKKLKAFPLRLGKRWGCPLLFNIVLEVPATATRKWRNKRYPNQKGRSKTVTADDRILYIENPKAATRKLLGSSMNLVKLQDTKLIHRNLLHF